MVINPYGVGLVCDYVEHPCHVAAIESARSEFEVGDFATENFGKKIITRSNLMRHVVKRCQDCGVRCLIDEAVANTIIEKFVDDDRFGIALEDQPFNIDDRPTT